MISLRILDKARSSTSPKCETSLSAVSNLTASILSDSKSNFNTGTEVNPKACAALTTPCPASIVLSLATITFL